MGELNALGLSSDQIQMYKSLGKMILYNKLESPMHFEIRRDLISYMDSRGQKSVTLDFRDARYSEMFEKSPLFTQITLTPDQWLYFEENEDIICNSMYVKLPDETKRKVDFVGSILRYYSEEIVNLKQFLIRLSDDYGKIRLYGYTPATSGYNRPNTGTFTYYSDSVPDNELDLNMPGNDPPTVSSKNDRFFVIDPLDLDSFEFRKFLGALLCDNQIFIIRSEGMGKNEILLAFGLFEGGLYPFEVIIGRIRVKPGFRRLGALYSNNPRYSALLVELGEILSSMRFPIYRFEDYASWDSTCSLGGVPED